MDSQRDKKRMNVEDDRISNLPEDLIHKILSFISIKHAIETSALSSRWRFLWQSMPYLNFSSEDFSTLPKFSKFVNHVLSHRNNLIEVHSVKLSFRGKVGQVFVKKILNYAFSHNVQQLNVVCLLEDDIEFPLSLFSSQSLKHLSLSKKTFMRFSRKCSMMLISTWELPALTTLHLDQISLYDGDNCIGLISKCVNLKNLTLKNCRLMGSNGFNICHSRLSELTLENVYYSVKFVNVVAPQLKNLIIKGLSKKILVSAPDLAYLLLQGYNRLDISADGFRSLDKADICISYPRDPIKIANLLQLLHSVKFLTLNLEVLELLSSSVELISHQPSSLSDLKSVKVYPVRVNEWELPEEKLTTGFTEIKKYLLESSPTATFTMISREDIIAQRLMAELQELLEHEKDIIGNMAHMEPGKAPTDNLSVQVEKRKAKACVIIWKLKDIEKLLTKLPASKRAVIQPCFSRLRAEADIIMNKISDCMKIQCDEYQSHLTVCFHELAAALHLPS